MATHTSSDAERSVSVLIISPNPKVHGGVSTLIETMKPLLTNCRVTSFWIGSISGEKESAAETIARFFISPFRVAWIVARGKFDVVHINPTFNAKSLPRDGFILLMLRLIRYRKVLVYFHGWQRSVEDDVKRMPPLRFLTAWLLNGAARVTVPGAGLQARPRRDGRRSPSDYLHAHDVRWSHAEEGRQRSCRLFEPQDDSFHVALRPGEGSV
jgi:hypothetical protein